MESGGEAERNFLRLGGWAGVVAGIVMVIAIIAFALQIPPPDGREQPLVSFSDVRTLTTLAVHLFSFAFLLGIAFLAALYRSLREPNRAYARMGLGSGVLAFVIVIVAAQGILLAIDAFSAIYDDPTLDRPVAVATYWAVASLLTGGINAAFLFMGLAFVAFGLAMRGSRGFSEAWAWFSAVLGIVIVLFTFLALPPVALATPAVLFLVLGWKVYSLSRAA